MALVYKTLGAESLDDFFSGGSPMEIREALEKGLDLMKENPERLAEAARPLEVDGKLPPNTSDELQQYWLAQPSGKEVERVIRLGYDQAIDLARKDPPKPVETFFVAGAGKEFELHICEGKYAVTVFMFVPEPRTWGSERARSNSWVVRSGGLREHTQEQLDDKDPAVVKTRVSGPK